MNTSSLKYFLLVLGFLAITDVTIAQKSRKSTKRTAKTKTKANVQESAPTAVESAPAAVSAPPPPPAPANDTLVKPVKKSLRPDYAVEVMSMNDRTPLNYEYLRADDAVYRHKLMRELDCREKMNLPFMHSADADNGNQRFISILLQALQDSLVTAFADERFTTPMTKSEISRMVAGDEIEVPLYDSLGVNIGSQKKRNEVNLDSFYRYHLKEEVIFDKESSRLFWRILGIAPVKNIVTSSGVDLGASELFWVYYPDLRPILSKYEVYNGKNFSGRMSWEELFENRMFSARIIKTSMDNPKDYLIKNYPGLTENALLQLFEGENVKEKILNYEQDLWSY
jgi:gliding motility associated protien GldN